MRLNYIDNIDCLEGLKEIPDKSVDLIITDPPYGIGIKSQGGRGSKLNPWADICNASLWYTAWMRECQRVLKDDGALWSFINWRYLPTLTKAGLDMGWSAESLLIWDKGWPATGGMKGLRTSYEMVALYAMPGFSIPDRTLRDVQLFKWSSVKPTGHPAEKPLDLIRWLIKASNKSGDCVVLDPFMGSGTTGVAAVIEGNKYLGFELDPNWVEKSRQRIEAETLTAETATPGNDEDWMA